MNSSTRLTERPLFLALAVAAGAGLWLAGGTDARADWPDNSTNVAKWYQFPDRSSSGYDILVGQPPPSPSGVGLPVILADDFQCTQTGPITDIHLWTSWLGLASTSPTGATNVPPLLITLAIWPDVPKTTNADGTVLPSHPGQGPLWSQTFGPGQYAARPVASVPNGESFWDPDPAPAGQILGTEFVLWQYNFYPTNPFIQNQGTIYWLSMTAASLQPSGPPGPFFGWKTSTNQWGDDAVFGHLDTSGNALGDWQELADPRSVGTAPRSLDLSFVLTTPEVGTNLPPPPKPPVKWYQGPNLLGGYDVQAAVPLVVADDFLCTAASTITNIQIWTSFYEDVLDPDLTFVLGIWTDALATPAGSFSHPGSLLWTETFAPGSYNSGQFAAGQEQFYNPATGQVSPESKVYVYSFAPRQPFCQQGSTNSPMVYWLSVYAVPGPNSLPGAQFGWKTSTNHFRDDAVFGTVDAHGNYANNWQELFAPIATAAVSLDMAFALNNGPPGPDCDPSLRPKWLELPDQSTNGLDVLATAPEVVGDDFLCRVPGPISGITFWGSWLNDLVDPNATFVLRLWSDAPATTAGPGYSHPGQFLCQTVFAAPSTVGTSVQRYQYSLVASNLQENFFNPDLGTAGLIGHDTQIWRYDFFPFQPGCWVQAGSPLTGPLIYWVTIDYLPSATPSQYLFGVKTATTHLLDDAVYGHLNADQFPLGDWKPIDDPRTGQSLDLSHALWSFPVHGINKDLVNTTTNTVTGIQLVVMGQHVITWHYDGATPWPMFQCTYAAGNTVLQWSGLSLPPGGTTHVGFEMAASANPQIVSINWMQGNTVLQPPVPQGNFHWLNNGTIWSIVNDLAPTPLLVSGAVVELYSGPVALDQMTANGTRSPMVTLQLPAVQEPLPPGGAALFGLPPQPPSAMYALFIVNLTTLPGVPGTTDYVLVPLDAALQPELNSVGLTGNQVNLTWSAVPGRTYHVQYRENLTTSGWMDTNLGDIMPPNAQGQAMLPVMGQQGFYRVYLLPQ